MGGVVHTVTDAVGLTDYAGQKRQEEAATAAANRGAKITEDEIRFQREQYADWKEIYGPIQKNLGDHYNNLNVDEYSARSVEAITAEFDKLDTDIKNSLAQRGIDDSGIAARAMTDIGIKEAMAKANVRANAHDIVAQKQMKFLGLGLGQGTQMLGTMGNVASNGANASASIACSHTAATAQMGAANIGSVGSVAGALGAAAILA